jgi:hypothetical protein
MKYVILIKGLDGESEEGEVKSRYGIIPPKPRKKKKVKEESCQFQKK